MNNVFSWENFRTLAPLTFEFKDCVLKQPLGSNKIGTKLKYIIIDFEFGYITIHTKHSGLERYIITFNFTQLTQ